jgi:hypothetical protein
MKHQHINLNDLPHQMRDLVKEIKGNKRYFQNKLSKERNSSRPDTYAMEIFEKAIQDYNDRLASLDQDVETLTKLLNKLGMSCRY